MPLNQRLIATPNASLVECHGHSLTNGGGLADPTDRVSAKLAGFCGSAQESNRSIAGACAACGDNVLSGTQGVGGYAWTLQRVVRPNRHKQPYEPGSDIVILQYGYNDMWNVASTGSPGVPSTQGMNAYIHAMRTIITRFRAAQVFENDHSSVTYASVNGGTWTSTPQPAQVPQQKGSGAMGSGSSYHALTGTAAQKNGSVVSIVLPGDYPGSAVCPLHVGFIADPLLTTGTITSGGTGIAAKTLTLDSASVTDTVLTPAKNNGLVLRFTGADIPASNGVSRTLTLTISATSAAGAVNFDYWGIEAQNPPIIYVLAITKPNASGSGMSGPFAGISDSHMATWNTNLQTLTTEFVGAGGSNNGNDGYTKFLDIDPLIGGAGWNGNASSITDNPLSAVATTINITGAGAAGLTSPVMIEQEIVTFTGNSGTQLTGCVRGTWETAAASHANTTSLRTISVPALANFSADGIHWAEGAQRQVAGRIWKDLAPLIVSPDINSDRVGPGRIDARFSGHASPSRKQLIASSTSTPVIFDVEDYDTVSMHDPNGPSVFSLSNSQVRILSDGYYRVMAAGQWEYTKAGQGVANDNGVRAFYVRKNGVTVVGGSGGSPDSTGVFNPFPVNVEWEGELKNGDYLELLAFHTGGGASTTLGASLTATTGTGISVLVASSAGFFVNDIVRCDNEHMLVTGIADGTHLTVTRAVTQTWPVAAHNSGAAIFSGFNVVEAGLTFHVKKEQTL